MMNEQLKSFRKTKGLSQAELGTMLGVDQSTVSRIEAGYEVRGPLLVLIENLLREDRPASYLAEAS